jgi:patatin-like phospholipase/acyl hydrolase
LLRGLHSLYDWKPFVDALGVFAAGKKISDFDNPIVFMTTRDVRTANTYFIVSKGRGAGKFADWPVIGAVAASGDAPIFFPPVLRNLVDGGVGVNGNPCLAATIEALEYIGAAVCDFSD